MLRAKKNSDRLIITEGSLRRELTSAHISSPPIKALDANIAMKHIEIDEIYRETHLEQIPWNTEIPPAALVALVESRIVTPCRAIDLGCGAGNYAVWLASKGFEVTGVDSAPTAIKAPRRTRRKKGSSARFSLPMFLAIWKTS